MGDTLLEAQGIQNARGIQNSSRSNSPRLNRRPSLTLPSFGGDDPLYGGLDSSLDRRQPQNEDPGSPRAETKDDSNSGKTISFGNGIFGGNGSMHSHPVIQESSKDQHEEPLRKGGHSL